MYKVKTKIRGYQPLCFVGKNLLLAKRRSLFISKGDLTDIRLLGRIPTGFLIRLLCSVRILSRIFRLNPRNAVNVEDKFVLVVFNNEIWKICLDTKEISLDFKIPNNKTVLNLSVVTSDNSSETKVVFGEYFNNSNKAPVNVWSRSSLARPNWSIVHTFREGQINHIHNILCDVKNNKLLILTGDFGDAAAIWESDLLFSKVKMVVGGDQVYRACWGTVHNNSIFYATDTQFQENYFCKFSYDGESTQLYPIEGSSIYKFDAKDQNFFSSVIEPGESKNNLLFDLFSYDLGKGILSNNSCIYSFNKEGKVIEVLKARKDFMPPRLGQFGTFMFPSGQSLNNDLIAFGVGLRGYDNMCILMIETNQTFEE